MASASSFFDCLSDYAVSLVSCCRCQQQLCEPVTLDCLHACCESCLLFGTNGEPTRNSSSRVVCPLCSTGIRDVVMPNGFLSNYQRLSAFCSEAVCCSTCEADDEVAAVFWCTDCITGLCDSCYSWHNKRHWRHRSAELTVARAWPLSKLMPPGLCESHKQPVVELCFTCGATKCLRCCVPCKAENHELLPLSHAETAKHLSTASEAFRTGLEQLFRLTSGLQKKCREVRCRLQGELGTNGHRIVAQGRRSLINSTGRSYDRSIVEVCSNLQRIWCMCTDVIAKPPTHSQIAFSAARHIKLLAAVRLKSLQLHRERNLLKMVSHRFLSAVGGLLRQQRIYWHENGGFSIDGALPLTSDVMLCSCLGTVYQNTAQLSAPAAPLVFSQVTVTFLATVACWDLAVTRDGHVLLAAAEHGLLVYSDRGQQLSSWRPERHSSGEEDQVQCLAALCDGRAAVGVLYAQLVVLLKLCETGDTWLEDRRVAVLQSPPWCLAVHSDLLAAAESRLDEQQQKWWPGRQVALLRLSSGHLLYRHSRGYDIYRVALTALCLLTVSRGPVKRNSGASPCVMDAYSHSGEFLWRHETSDEELVWGLCVSEDTWRRVYAVVGRRVLSSNRVMAFSGSDGRDIREIMSSRTHGLQLPWLLSLARGQQRTVLAVLDYDREAKEARTVSLYEATSE